MKKSLYKIKVRLPAFQYLIHKSSLLLHPYDTGSQGLPIAHIELDTEPSKVFATPAPSGTIGFRSYLLDRGKRLFAPLRTAFGFSNLILMTIASTLLFFISVFLVRGWRLEVVRRLALVDAQPVAGIGALWRYIRKGFVLFLMRGLYFLPEAILLYIFGESLFMALLDVVWWIKDIILLKENSSFLELLMVKVVPEVTVGILVHLIVALIYTVVVWPVYRITMVKYAIGQISGWGFLNPVVISNSFRIFQQNAGLTLGIYFWTLAVDFFLIAGTLFVLPILTVATLGTGNFLLPAFHLVFRHWPKAYSYGILGRKLIERGYLRLRETPLREEIPSEFV